jgi:hypothetical protein
LSESVSYVYPPRFLRAVRLDYALLNPAVGRTGFESVY